MTKIQFMAELKQLLGELPVEEREEALNYYEDYFADAGEENEEKVIAELGSPEKVAYTIKSGLEDVDKNEGEFTETGFTGYESPYKDELVYREVQSERFNYKKILNNRSNLVLAVIAVIILAPIVIPIVMGAIGTVFGLVVAAFSIIFAILITGIALSVSGVVTLIVGISVVLTFKMTGLIIIGTALVLLGFGSIITKIGARVISHVVPAIIRGLVSICKRIFVKLVPGKVV